MMMATAVSKKEWGVVLLLSLVIMGFTAIPFLYGYAITPPGQVFTGIDNSSPSDTYTYAAWMEQARQGHELFQGLYTAEPQPRLLFHPLFLGLGKLSGWLNIHNIVIYQGARLIAGVLFLLLLYKFISYFFENKPERLIAFIIMMTSSGLGWAMNGSSADLWMTELLVFLNLYQALLGVVALILVLLIFIIVLKRFGEQGLAGPIWAGVLLNLLILLHGYEYFLVMLVAGIYSLYLWGKHRNFVVLRNFLFLLLLSFPSIFWQLHVLEKNPVLGLWSTVQTSVPSPLVIDYITGYGFLLIFALLGLGLVWLRRQQKYYFLLIWLGTALALTYFPLLFRLQRKLGAGLHIPLVVMATLGLVWFAKSIAANRPILQSYLLSSLIILFTFTNIYVLHRDIKVYASLVRPFHIEQGRYEAIEWLKDNTAESDVILAGYELGNLIPGIAGRTVYLGHYDQTVNLKEKYDLAQRMLGAEPRALDPLENFVRLNSIDYAIIDNEVRSWGNYPLAGRPYLTLVYENIDVEIYKVK